MALSLVLTLASTPAVAGDYKLGVSDRLKIKVQDWPDLAGVYAVAADGDLSLPLIGNIHVIGEDLNALSEEISKRLQQRAAGGRAPVVALEIAQYRPFSIVGDVQRPGDYPYQPGLTVLQAIAIAGGYYRPEFGLLRLGRDVALARGKMLTLMLKKNRLLARQARLTAALAGQDNFTVPPELAAQKDNPAISAILRGERAALAEENHTAHSEQSGFETVKALYLHEIDSLKGQVQALAHERKTTEQQLNKLRGLSARGLALAPTLFTMERAVARIVNQQLGIETAIVRAQENIALAKQQVDEHSRTRKQQDTKDLQKTKDQLAEVRSQIGTQGDLLTEAETAAPAEARARLGESGQRPAVTLIRKDGKTIRKVSADDMTSVMPGDIVKVPTTHPGPYSPSDVAKLSQSGTTEKTAR
jgi:protein involved in polysaccharide export with SLBB domain